MGGERAHPAKVRRSLFRRNGHDRNLQAPADGFRNILQADAFFGHAMIPRARLMFLEREPVEPGDIGNMRRGPAALPVSNIRGYALLPRDRDDIRD